MTDPVRSVLPHSLNSSTTSSVCLITSDPQRAYKNIVADENMFPRDLAARIGRVIGLSKLKAKYKSYESKRQLRAQYDIFLADDRIITYLPKVLGKTFYQSSRYRPIPVTLTGGANKPKPADGKKPPKATEGTIVGSPEAIAKDIQRALSSAVVYPKSTNQLDVVVGCANWKPEMLRENILALAPALIDKHVPLRWRGVRSVHIKGSHTLSFPIWLAEEIWRTPADIVDERPQPPGKAQLKQQRELRRAIKAETAPEKKPIEEWDEVNEDGVIETKKRKQIDEEEFKREYTERKAKAKKQRSKLMESAGGVIL